MHAITKPPKKVILEDIKKKKFKCNECDHQPTEKSNLRRHQKKKNLNAMNVITNPLKKVILEDIKKKI